MSRFIFTVFAPFPVSAAINETSDRIRLVDNDGLYIANVTEEDIGEYTCTVK